MHILYTLYKASFRSSNEHCESRGTIIELLPTKAIIQFRQLTSAFRQIGLGPSCENFTVSAFLDEFPEYGLGIDGIKPARYLWRKLERERERQQRG